MTAERVGTKESGVLSRTISPELRRRLQERYAQAQSRMARPGYDFSAVHRLLAENLASDPGNLRYIELLLLNLQRRSAAGSRAGLMHRLVGSTPLGARAALERALSGKRWLEAVRLAADALWSHGLDAEVLGSAGDACAGLELGPAELLYRRAAVGAASTNPEPVRRMATALVRLGQYDDARDWWRRLLTLLPGDAEAVAGLALNANVGATPEEMKLREAISANPTDVDSLLRLVESRRAAADFEEAQQLLQQASSVGGGDLRVREAWETLSLTQSENRLKLAREADERERSPESAKRVAIIAEEHDRLALGIVHSRAERFPGDGNLKLDLGRKLKRAGNYSGAVQRFEELRELAGFERIALVELGECWQHLRQYTKALDYYQEAIDLPGGAEESEVEHLALYRGAVLAEALGRANDACRSLERLTASAGEYKDARERLDKLRPICDKNGFSAG